MLDKLEIGGRTALVSYLLEDFTPATADTAELIKAVFDDGDVMFLAPAARKPLDQLQARMETARGEWWERLTREEQEQYIKEHPETELRPTAQPSNRPAPPPDPGREDEGTRPPQATEGDDGPSSERLEPISDAEAQPSKWLRKGMTAAGENRAALPSHIKALKLPPGWKQLQYNENPDADLLVIGKDAKGRDQYVYSDKFIAANQASKFARIREMDSKFEDMLSQTRRDQQDSGPKGTHATVAELVFLTGIRPGSDDDTGADKKAYGDTTLKGEHVKVDEEGRVRLQFTGKKGVDLDLPVPDAELSRKLAERKAKAGDDGQLFPEVDDASLRDYVKTLDGGDFKTKDIRTALGTRLARQAMQKLPVPSNAKDYKNAAKEVGKVVSQVLGNTPSVALTSYIDPTLFTPWRAAAGV